MRTYHRMKEEFTKAIPDDLDLCLLGLQGSRGLGMALTNDADYDYRGVFVANNRDLLSLNKPKETIEINSGAGDGEAEFVFHEVEKFIRLCMKGNPSVLEVLFVPKFNYKNNVGDQLIANKHILFGERAIRAAFGGYAMSQMMLLKRRNKFQSKIQNAKKHIRHCFRLFDQGQELLETGSITFPLADPQKYIDLGEEQDQEKIFKLFEERDRAFRAAKSILPPEPDLFAANQMLLTIRGV